MNAAVGWYQEKQAGDIVAKLKAGIAMKSTVIRDGHEQEIEARELVPGDIVSFATSALTLFRLLLPASISASLANSYTLRSFSKKARRSQLMRASCATTRRRTRPMFTTASKSSNAPRRLRRMAAKASTTTTMMMKRRTQSRRSAARPLFPSTSPPSPESRSLSTSSSARPPTTPAA